MIDVMAMRRRVESVNESMGAAVSNRAVTAKLHVSPNGDNSDGSTPSKAYNQIQDALDAANAGANDCTLILIAPSAMYDINTTGDPTWAGNYILQGTHILWNPIRNTHASATSVMNFTGNVSLRDLGIFTTGTTNGISVAGNGFDLHNLGFNSEGLTGAATSIHIDGSSGITRGGHINHVHILGHLTHTTGLHVNGHKHGSFSHFHIHLAAVGIHIANAGSDYNNFTNFDIGDCQVGIDIDAGNEQLFQSITFHHNDNNIDDEVGNSTWSDIRGEFDVTLEPDDFTGITVATNAAADTWTTVPVEIRAAASSAHKPFKIVATIAEANANEKFRIRFSADSGVTWFDDISIEGAINAQQREASVAPPSTDHIFNKGTQIVAAAKSESGSNQVAVWIQLQVI